MELADLSRDYGDFYAPAFSVRVGGVDVVRDLLVAVSQVETELVMNTASSFSFTLSDCYSYKSHSFVTGRGADVLGIFTLGAEIEICIGYGDAGAVPTTLLGVVTNITTSFPETGAPELVVSGFDHGHALTFGTKSESWRDRTHADVVRQIASRHNLDVVVDPTPERHRQIEQNQLSDWDFLLKLAKRSSAGDIASNFEVYVDPGTARKATLHFAKPRARSSPVLRLVWGEGLLSFRPEANLAGQVARVEVYAWDVKRKEAIVGKASSDGGNGRAKSVGDHLGTMVRAPDRAPTMRVRQPSFSQSEADQRARAALSEKDKKFLTGDAEAIGLPELRPDCVVQIDNVGKLFSKNYYIERASHRIDSGGYRTRFKVRETRL
jgi:phage protein D